MLSGNKLCLLFLIEANSSTAAGGTGIEIANNCFPKKIRGAGIPFAQLTQRGNSFFGIMLRAACKPIRKRHSFEAKVYPD
jgi:hypothetical protein